MAAARRQQGACPLAGGTSSSFIHGRSRLIHIVGAQVGAAVVRFAYRVRRRGVAFVTAGAASLFPQGTRPGLFVAKLHATRLPPRAPDANGGGTV